VTASNATDNLVLEITEDDIKKYVTGNEVLYVGVFAENIWVSPQGMYYNIEVTIDDPTAEIVNAVMLSSFVVLCAGTCVSNDNQPY
jgi:hypothetical protein